MSFTSEQRKMLAARLNGRMVRERTQNGQVLAYVEGWFAIAEANRIFGFDGWDQRDHLGPLRLGGGTARAL